MPIWKLEPVDFSSEHWACSPHKGVAIVRAPDEGSARRAMLVIREAVDVGSPSAPTLHSPWQDSRLVRCTRMNDSGFEESGPTKVLEPAEDD